MAKTSKVADLQSDGKFDAFPSKNFFIDMLTRDIPLEWAILDLIDNSVDGARNEIIAKRKNYKDAKSYKGFYIHLTLNKNEFIIADNCGGFSKKAATDYTFKFGRPENSKGEFPKGSVGRFGVGMKRGMFKLGSYFVVETKHEKDHFIVEQDIVKWNDPNSKWEFEYIDVKKGAKYSNHKPTLDVSGTYIKVTNLRETVRQDFDTSNFKKRLTDEIQRTLSYSIQNGLEVKVNGNKLEAKTIGLLTAKNLSPYYLEEKISDVTIKIYAGIAEPDPNEAGWYIFCNDRLMVEKDRTNLTGWEGGDKFTGEPGVQKFHNKVAMFRGLVFFSADKSSSLPMTTTKIGIDINSAIYKSTRSKMITAMKTVLSYLNKLENDQQRQAIVTASKEVDIVKYDHSKLKAAFVFPEVKKKKTEEKGKKISYEVPKELFELVRKDLGVTSGEDVGVETFNYYVQMKELE